MKELFVEMSILSDAQMEMVFGGRVRKAVSTNGTEDESTVIIDDNQVPL